jgi:hypothetical protein
MQQGCFSIGTLKSSKSPNIIHYLDILSNLISKANINDPLKTFSGQTLGELFNLRSSLQRGFIVAKIDQSVCLNLFL